METEIRQVRLGDDKRPELSRPGLMRAKTPIPGTMPQRRRMRRMPLRQPGTGVHIWKASGIRGPTIRQGPRRREVRLAKTAPKFVWPKCNSPYPAGRIARHKRECPSDRPDYRNDKERIMNIGYFERIATGFSLAAEAIASG